MKKLSVRELPISGRRVFVRVDFNVPINENGEITDDTRIRAALPTIRWLMEQKAIVVLGSHLGKPKGKFDPKFRLQPVAKHLQQLLGQEVIFAPDCIGADVVQLLRGVIPGSVVLLENLRFYPGEEKNEPAFAQALASLVDFYVNDAFGTAHRAHASTFGMPRFFAQPAAGFLMERELEYLGGVLESPKRPFVVIVGGAKVSDKAGVIKNLLPKVDRLLIGGGVAFTFLKACGYAIGKSIWEPNLMDEVEKIKGNPKIVLPGDVKVATTPEGEDVKTVKIDAITEESIGFDIGEETIAAFVEIITSAQTIVWAGPLGMFEKAPFRKGTMAIAKAIGNATLKGAVTVVGGGDTVAAVHIAGVADKISHISTGGGATLEFLEGKNLPGVTVLTDSE